MYPTHSYTSSPVNSSWTHSHNNNGWPYNLNPWYGYQQAPHMLELGSYRGTWVTPGATALALTSSFQLQYYLDQRLSILPNTPTGAYYFEYAYNVVHLLLKPCLSVFLDCYLSWWKVKIHPLYRSQGLSYAQTGTHEESTLFVLEVPFHNCHKVPLSDIFSALGALFK